MVPGVYHLVKTTEYDIIHIIAALDLNSIKHQVFHEQWLLSFDIVLHI